MGKGRAYLNLRTLSFQHLYWDACGAKVLIQARGASMIGLLRTVLRLAQEMDPQFATRLLEVARIHGPRKYFAGERSGLRIDSRTDLECEQVVKIWLNKNLSGDCIAVAMSEIIQALDATKSAKELSV